MAVQAKILDSRFGGQSATILNWGSNPTESGEPGSLTAEVARALDNGSRSRITLSGRSTHDEIPAEPREPAR